MNEHASPRRAATSGAFWALIHGHLTGKEYWGLVVWAKVGLEPLHPAADAWVKAMIDA